MKPDATSWPLICRDAWMSTIHVREIRIPSYATRPKLSVLRILSAGMIRSPIRVGVIDLTVSDVNQLIVFS